MDALMNPLKIPKTVSPFCFSVLTSLGCCTFAAAVIIKTVLRSTWHCLLLLFNAFYAVMIPNPSLKTLGCLCRCPCSLGLSP